ncbi:MAG TPA: glycoside hydrolase, partial [Chitinophagaceae bacterium]|nr:glycoside hydrolase [Chitinophagaceae bacterium]
MKYFLACLAVIANLSVCAQTNTVTIFTIHTNDTLQQISNIGASACWYGEEVGGQWPAAQKQRMAQLLFSRR